MPVKFTNDLPTEAEGLGDPIADFRSGSFQYLLFLSVGSLGVLFGLAWLGIVVAVFFIALFRGPKPRFGGFGATLPGIVLLSGGLATLYRASRSRSLQVYVFTGGLARVQRNQAEVLRWEDINEVRRNPNPKTKGLTVTWPSQLIFKLRDGRQLIFDESLSRLKDLRTLVEEHTRDFMFTALLEALQVGAAVAFGSLAVSAEGIFNGTTAMPWTECASVKVGGGSLIVSCTGAKRAFCKVPLEEVPNPHVLTALADHLTGKRG